MVDWDVKIIATDINRNFLAKAKEGHFDDWAFRSTSPELRKEHFTQTGKKFAILPELKALVTFQYHNLILHPFPSLLTNLSAFDLIICRNVMIYFSTAIIKTLAPCFLNSLVDQGWLIVGHAEPNSEIFGMFKTVQVPGSIFYQRTSLQPAVQTRSYSISTQELPVIFEVASPDLPSTPSPVLNDEPAIQVVDAELEIKEIKEIKKLADQGKFELATKLCDRMILSEKLNPIPYFYKGLMHEQLGKHDEATKTLKQALYLKNDFILAHFYLANLARGRNDLLESKRHFKQVLRLIEGLQPGQILEHADGMKVEELKNFVQRCLEAV